MSKKQKRKVSQSSAVPAASRPSTPEVIAAVPAAPVVRNRSSVTYSSEFNPDYAPVIKDLKRIGILAGSFIAILVALSFFLH
jgi:hypothetical protein